ncbi:hypothetical protein [Paenibacillus typhae]|uniref:Uncharacterized protein n=1 Tax=Paenibacillus typhae TaxID=1174501 RepID=A0A1G9BGC5_9BACL|nr:hypothetical protein [Paenibacillus typhae]SDK38250.1 hypothetical protein SAMN05216192_14019 [Paenibacillus typhae]
MKKVVIKFITVLTMFSLVVLPLGPVVKAEESYESNFTSISNTEGIVEEEGVFNADGVTITYNIEVESDIITYNLINNGVEQIIKVNQSTGEIWVDGIPTDLSSLLHPSNSSDSSLNSSIVSPAATTIPPDVGLTAYGPKGENGQLTKYTESNSQYTKVTMSALAAALSTLVKAPYSAVLAALSVIIGADQSATVYYREQLYYTGNPMNYWFTIFKTYSDSNFKNQISRDVYYVMIW